MILMSPTQEFDQGTPVTTTYDPTGDRPRHHQGTRPRTRRVLDWSRVETLYAFARERATERLRAAERVGDRQEAGLERIGLHVLDSMYAQAKNRDEVLVASAVSYFRARAMRDAHHPDFHGSWIASAN